MNYKYKKGQIFGKRLNVPRSVLTRVYRNACTYSDFVDYELFDKIPTSCMRKSDLAILNKFGKDICDNLDWEIISDTNGDMNVFNIVMSLNPNTKDINLALYEKIKDRIRLSEYSTKMRELYSDRFIEPTEDKIERYGPIIDDFNYGRASLSTMVKNWDLFKDRDLSYCLLHDKANEKHVTDAMVKNFMSNHSGLAPIIAKNEDIYSVISDISIFSTLEEEKAYLKQLTDNILSKTKKQYGDYTEPLKLSNDEYKELFKYSSMKDYLSQYDSFGGDLLVEELKKLPEDYVFNNSIPFQELLNYDVLHFVGTFGIKNIAEFDDECGQFFTRDNCRMLKLMFDMYMHYGGNVHNPNLSFFYNRENKPIRAGSCSKDDFYDAMRKMIVFGPTDGTLKDKAPDYRAITGEFRTRNSDLFISEDAPEELQKLFYSKSITPKLLKEHPDYIDYLRGKDFACCFKDRYAYVEYEDEGISTYENFYSYISWISNDEEMMNFILEYGDVLDIVYDYNRRNYSGLDLELPFKGSLYDVKDKINTELRKIIIQDRVPYPANVPDSFYKLYPEMFLDKDSPKELQDAFYSRSLTAEDILMNPSYREYLNGIDLELLFKYMSVRVYQDEASSHYSTFYDYEDVNLIKFIEDTFGRDEAFEIMLSYGKYVEAIYDIDTLRDLSLYKKVSKDKLLGEFDRLILKGIIDGKIIYDENMPDHFKKTNPTLFLDDNVPQDIKDKFYNRRFTISDFLDNLELLDTIGNANIACGLSQDMSWAIALFNDAENPKVANLNRLKVLGAYEKIDDVELRKAFVQFILENGDTIDLEKIDNLSTVLHRLSQSNSSEIFRFRKELASQILASDDPIKSLSLIEDLFVKNNIPTVGKVYSCFEILHPDFKGFNFEYSTVSPILQTASTGKRKIIIFSDLIKASFGSNNKSVNAYLRNIDIGSKLYDDIRTGKIQYEDLSEEEKSELKTFSKHLETLYNNTLRAKTKNDAFSLTGDVVADILELSKKLSSNGDLDYNLGDRVIRMFCGFAGISTVEEAKEYISGKVITADQRNRSAATRKMVLEKGDFVKGIGGITYLRNILQNGSVSKEYLGSSADSDATPLDTDVSMIIDGDSPREMINSTAASGYGPIWFVLKNDDRFITTRTNEESFPDRKDRSKIEVFHTGVFGEGHYGIRTGFASSEIDYIVMDSFDPRVGLEIAMNGFYIPVANKDGEIIFTPEDYDILREKMSGLSYYGEDEFKFSPNLVNEETSLIALEIEESNRQTEAKREKINAAIRSALDELGLELKTSIDGDLTEGFVELIDTGSTGRGTNKPGDGDFDFMMRLDKTLLSDPERLSQLKQKILQKLGKENTHEVTGTGDFRLKGVKIDEDTDVDIDITFAPKTDKVAYSTDMALQDRLETIKKNDPEKYNYVVANILLAKRVLKEADAYKPNRGENPQGGLGGVGIENWVLQNGGSFEDAVSSFLAAAVDENGEIIPFERFSTNYQIWDYGENHLAEKRGHYAHDNFVTGNMSSEGYSKMVHALKAYQKTIDKEKGSSITTDRERNK